LFIVAEGVKTKKSRSKSQKNVQISVVFEADNYPWAEALTYLMILLKGKT
jgi:hypothetical protein